jgi:uncharacterized protein YjbI with pentapeptide repeats
VITQPRHDWLQILATALPGLAAFGALIFTWLSISATTSATNNQIQIAEQGQVTDRYNAAIANLGSSSIDVRLGGIYALQRIIEESPEDQPTVVAVLCAFVRDHTDGINPQARYVLPKTDVQAALTVVGTRNPSHDSSANAVDFSYAEITDTDLVGLKFPGADFAYGFLSGANLDKANLAGANLTETILGGAHLIDTNLTHANLSGAQFDEADLTGADLRNADVSGAFIGDAILFGANLAHEDLSGMNLSFANLSHADLSHADLSHADLSHADLSHADLSHADLSGADLSGADLRGAVGLPVRISSATPAATR